MFVRKANSKKNLLSLPGILAAEHLLGLEIFRVVCCTQLMDLDDVRSVLATENIWFSRIIFFLRCSVCGHCVELETLTQDNGRREEMCEVIMLELGSLQEKEEVE